MPKYRKKIWAGDVYEIEEYYSPRTIGKNYEKNISSGCTTEEQAKRNLEIARKKLTRLINCNFSSNDYFVTLTFDSQKNIEEARNAVTNFFRRFKRWREKNNFSELKYICVLEVESRPHFHVVMNGLGRSTIKEAIEIISSVWKNGLVFIKKLFKAQEDTRLATYITKENIEKNARRWTQSRNLEKPKVKIEKIEGKSRKLKAPKDYVVIYNIETFFVEIGYLRYLKAVKKGGMDYGEYNGEGI